LTWAGETEATFERSLSANVDHLHRDDRGRGNAARRRQRRPDRKVKVVAALALLASLLAVTGCGSNGGESSFADYGSRAQSVGFSPDGRILAAAYGDASVRLWNIRTHKQIGRPLRGEAAERLEFGPGARMHRHLGPLLGRIDVTSIAWSPDDRIIASGSGLDDITLWSARTRRKLGLLTLLPWPSNLFYSNIDGIAFSPDGRWLAATNAAGQIGLWDVRQRAQISGPSAPGGITDDTNALAFAPDSRSLAGAGSDGSIYLWDVRTGIEMSQPLAGHRGVVNCVAFSPDGRTLASGGKDKTVRFWNVRRHQQVGEALADPAGEALSVAFSPDGRLLAVGSHGTVLLYDVRTRKELAPLVSG
jgi:WD40 repeat protein